jgi:hypothetical protein
MSYTSHDFADDVIAQLQRDGYQVHGAETLPTPGPIEPASHWFTWSVPGMADCEVGDDCESPLAAWSSALAHRLSNSAIPLHRGNDAPRLASVETWRATERTQYNHYGRPAVEQVPCIYSDCGLPQGNGPDACIALLYAGDSASRFCDGRRHHTVTLEEQRTNARKMAEAPELVRLVEQAAAFIAGFEDDNAQQGVPALLQAMRASLARIAGEA